LEKGRYGAFLLSSCFAFSSFKTDSLHPLSSPQTAYMFRLYLEWARLLTDDPADAEYLIEDHPDHP